MITLAGEPSAIYTRASYDPATGTVHEGVSVTSQEADCRRAAADLGCTVTEVYSDNDLSASRYSKKARTNWDRLLADIEAGHVKAVILWESARGSRQLHEWALFLELCRQHAPYLHIVSQDETYDIRKPRDWKILATEGIDSASESDKISGRVRRGKASARGKGRPSSTAPFGYRRVYDPDSGRMTTQEPVAEEAPVVVELYERIVGGEALSAIARDWNERAALPEGDPQRMPKTRRGCNWEPQRMRKMALSPAYMGWQYDPGTNDLIQGNWPGIVPPELWRSVHAILDARSRAGARPGKAKYLLSNIIRCGVCGSKMGVFNVKGLPRYVCRGMNDDRSPKAKKGCTAIRMSWADEFIEDKIIRMIADPEALAALMADESIEALAARAKADEIKGDLKRMWSSVKARELEYEEYMEVKRAWEPEIARLEEQADGLDKESAAAILAALNNVASGEEERLVIARKTWEHAALSAQREWVRLLFPKLRVMLGTPGRHAFDPERIKTG